MTKRSTKDTKQPAAELREIPLDAVREGKLRLRNVGDEEKMEDLRLSISQRGVLIPIVVRELKKGFELICGRRRTICARAVGLATIPAMVVKASKEWAAWACLTENRVREQVNPVDEALWLAEVMKRDKISQRTLAERLNVSEQYVGQRLSTLHWPGDVREAVLQQEISFSVGRELCQITEESHRKHLLRIASTSGCTARQAGDWRRAWLREQSGSECEGNGAAGIEPGELDRAAPGSCSMCGADDTKGKGQQVYLCETCSKAVRLASSS